MSILSTTYPRHQYSAFKRIQHSGFPELAINHTNNEAKTLQPQNPNFNLAFTTNPKSDKPIPEFIKNNSNGLNTALLTMQANNVTSKIIYLANSTKIICHSINAQIVKLTAYNPNQQIKFKISQSSQGNFKLTDAFNNILDLKTQSLILNDAGYVNCQSNEYTKIINLNDEFIIEQKIINDLNNLRITFYNIYLFSGIKICTYYQSIKKNDLLINQFKDLLKFGEKLKQRDFRPQTAQRSIPFSPYPNKLFRFWGNCGNYLDFTTIEDIKIFKPDKIGLMNNHTPTKRSNYFSAWDSVNFCLNKKIFTKQSLNIGGL